LSPSWLHLSATPREPTATSIIFSKLPRSQNVNPIRTGYYAELNKRTSDSLDAVRRVFASHRQPEQINRKSDGSSLTKLDIQICSTLRTALVREGEGWLSEEDSPLDRSSSEHCTWIVDPIDGTREYVLGIPEFAVSIAAWVTDELAVGLIFNPVTGQIIRGGVNLSCASEITSEGAGAHEILGNKTGSIKMLVSRSEIEQDPRWRNLDPDSIEITPCGSIAYKLGLMAAGTVDAVVSLAPKSSWDIAAGTILVRAAGGFVTDLSGKEIQVGEFRRVNGVIAGRTVHRDELLATFSDHPTSC